MSLSKVRKFYPRQVLLRLRGRKVESLSALEQSALQFFAFTGRLRGYDLSILEDGIVRISVRGHGAPQVTVLGLWAPYADPRAKLRKGVLVYTLPAGLHRKGVSNEEA